MTCAFGHQASLRSLDASFGRLGAGQAHQAYATAKHAAERMVGQKGLEAVRRLLARLKESTFDSAFQAEAGEPWESWATRFDAEGRP